MVATTSPPRSTPSRLSSVARDLSGVVDVGKEVGPYVLCHKLGRGGMATVFLARLRAEVGYRPFVALKCMQPSLCASEEFLDMFEDEAMIASRIHHPHVCTVLDFDVHAGVPYLVMEFLSGETLRTVQDRLAHEIATETDPLHRVGILAHIMAECAEGLHAAHELRGPDGACLNVVHRDVSPENLFVTHDGMAKVVDFGVAAAARKHHETRAGIVKGKFAYLAPEVLMGARADRRADIWGLGVVIWELLTGRRLFRRDTDAATLNAVSEMRIPAPSQVVPSIPAAMDDIVFKALCRDPGGRFTTIREMGKAFTRFNAKHNLAIGMAEVAAFMDHFFPGQRSRGREVLQSAETAFIECTTILGTGSVEFLPRLDAGQPEADPQSAGNPLSPRSRGKPTPTPNPTDGSRTTVFAANRVGAIWAACSLAFLTSLISLVWQALDTKSPPAPPPESVGTLQEAPVITPIHDPQTTQVSPTGVEQGTPPPSETAREKAAMMVGADAPSNRERSQDLARTGRRQSSRQDPLPREQIPPDRTGEAHGRLLTQSQRLRFSLPLTEPQLLPQMQPIPEARSALEGSRPLPKAVAPPPFSMPQNEVVPGETSRRLE